MPHKRYFEDLELDECFVSQGRPITEADSALWSMVTADWTPLHVDEEFARTTPFGTRIPPGLMSQAITHGLLSRLDGDAAAQRRGAMAAEPLPWSHWLPRPLDPGDHGSIAAQPRARPL